MLSMFVCRKIGQKICEQKTSSLPMERLKPAPAWDATALNFFSPFKVKDEVKKRITGKDYGLIFNCLATRAVYVDVSPDYSSKKFLMALRRFISIRGYPLKLYLDNRAQLVAANKELKKVVKVLDSRSLQQFGVMQGLKWSQHRYEFLQKIVDNFRRRWTRDYFPNLFIKQKWHTTKNES